MNVLTRFSPHRPSPSSLWRTSVRELLISLLVATILIAILSFAVFAQPGQPGQAPKIRVTGKIIDSESQKPIKSASVYMKHLGDNSITGDIADTVGFFSVSNAKPGRYHIAVTFLGFGKYKDTITIDASKPAVNLGTISLKPASTILGEVSVSAERETIELAADKKIFNVGKSPTATGGTALDVLRQTPTVEVDVNGNVSMRGSSNLIIQINGKQSGFVGSDRSAILQQIPANMVEKIELVTNPSARYDAEGMAGIINIITKQNVAQSWSLTTIVGAGTNHKYNSSLDFGYKEGPVNLTLGYGARYNQFDFAVDIFRDETTGDRTHLDQALRMRMTGVSHFANLNLDYSLTDKATLNVNAQGRLNDGKSAETIDSRFARSTGEIYDWTYRNNENKRDWRGMDFGAGFRQNLTDTKHYLDITGRYSYNKGLTFADISEQLYETNGTPKNTLPALQNNDLINEFSISTIQADYIQPHASGKFETGVKATFRTIDNDSYADSLNRNLNEYIKNVQMINHFTFNERVLAAYVMYGTKISDINIQAGVRVENTSITTLQSVGNLAGDNTYTHFFPSLHFSKKFDDGYEAQISYSRRINRPQFWQLNPFPEITNAAFIRKGDPKVMPELIDSYEATFMANIEQHTLTATAYFRQTNDVMQPYLTFDSTTGVTTMQFRNFDIARNVGGELVYRGKVLPWWTLTANVNVFKNSLQSSGEVGDIGVGRITYTGRLISNMNTPWEGGSLQMIYGYNGPVVLAQGERKEFHDLTLGFRQDLSKEFSITFNVSDVFDTRLFKVLIAGTGFEGGAHQKPETRIATINLTYRLGATRMENRRRDNGGDMQQMQGGVGF